MHVAIAGNIGSGKTTLTELLAKHFKWTPIYEQMDDNPYIANFYEDMRRWSFNLQVYFLHKRFKYVIDSRNTYDNIVQDRTLYEDAYIFAPNLHAMGLMNTRDFETYKSLFDLMESFITPPDLLIYLKASVPTLIKQIELMNKYKDPHNAMLEARKHTAWYMYRLRGAANLRKMCANITTMDDVINITKLALAENKD